MRFLNGQIPPYELTYHDVFMVPSVSSVGSRMSVDLATSDETGTTIPLVIANMTAVAGRRMAETVARRGGIVILPQDVPAEIAAETIARVKNAHPVFESPITVKPHHTVGYTRNLLHKRAHGAAIVVEGDRPVGVVTEKDIAKVDNFAQVGTLMSANVMTLPSSITPQESFRTLNEHGRRLAPVVASDGTLVGIVTKQSALRATLYKPALDADGKLRVGAAIGINGDVAGRAQKLIDAGADVLVVDTAHGHQTHTMEALKKVRELNPPVPVAAGNVVTADGVRDLVAAGADIIKVGVGPGAMCTTRMQTGVGRPQFSAVLECAAEAKKLGAHVWADGGVRDPRDVALALAAGASNVMIGSWFAGTFESPGDMHYDLDGRMYKESFGMASRRAVVNRNSDTEAFEKARREMFEEGISSAKIYLEEGKGGVEDLIDHIISGVRSSFTYAGSDSIATFQDRAVVGVQSAAGFAEGMARPTR
ncbi:GuaB1 family IMP dehydrogenase-related protein [Corynebacterium pseudotuberculosis]|uniref:GuaB1 family IMP dehydrogenase-related protein n=1 Tax=Corynebacterium pseudotuberculosis TaxID=1719 RepID=UPI00059B6F64|nr:GuaB1 family IMP dehydrogenase-related protein [Corynebacterium pseudotuberculosis]AFM07781.2 GuaB1 family IMP dehydrogenase-related protein [Corynebacterium pseudotuberculosis Cp162]APG82014.1 Inosine 5-monophosphate dehydrogenase [Corynebacterium pseudotuberculosis]WFP66600.1 GuaB1 family IMP dehydrogenase-related protein [Corynebacterium pseudotuberculosis]